MGTKLATEAALREGIRSLLGPVRTMLSSPGIEGVARASDVERAARNVAPLLIQPQPSLLAFERLALFVNAADDAGQRRRERRNHADADVALQAEWLEAAEFLTGT
jgi:hypothetical protein